MSDYQMLLSPGAVVGLVTSDENATYELLDEARKSESLFLSFDLNARPPEGATQGLIVGSIPVGAIKAAMAETGLLKTVDAFLRSKKADPTDRIVFEDMLVVPIGGGAFYELLTKAEVSDSDISKVLILATANT